jgi:hypothetical protein
VKHRIGYAQAARVNAEYYAIWAAQMRARKAFEWKAYCETFDRRLDQFMRNLCPGDP